MLNNNNSKRKIINTIILMLFFVIGFAALTMCVRKLYSIPENISMWAKSPDYPYEFNLNEFSMALKDATAVGVIEKAYVQGNKSSMPGVDIVLIDSHFKNLYTPKMESGKFFWEEDYGRMAAVINKSLAFQLFGYTDCMGEEITYMGHMYTIIGVCSDSYIRYPKEKYCVYLPNSRILKYTTSYIGIAAIPYKTKTIVKQELNKFMASRYENYETVDTISCKQTIWFGLKLSLIPILGFLFFWAGRYIKLKVKKRIGTFRQKLKDQYLSRILPEIIVWTLLYALLLLVVFKILKFMYNQLLYDLSSLGENYSIAAVDSKNLANLISGVQNMTAKDVKLAELIEIRDAGILLCISVVFFYLFGLVGFVTGIFRSIIERIKLYLRRKRYSIYNYMISIGENFYK